MAAIATPDLWLPRQGIGLTQGLQILLTPFGESITQTPWMHSDQNNVFYTTARNRLIQQERYGNFRAGATTNIRTATSGKLPIVTGKSGAGPAVIPTTPTIQRQFRKLSGDFTYFYLGWFPALDATYGLPLWAMFNEPIDFGSSDYSVLDYNTAASFGGNRELLFGGVGTTASYTGLRITWTQVAARDSMTMISYTNLAGGGASVYQADPYTSISPTVSGTIDWTRTYATFQIPVNDADKKAAEITTGNFNMYSPSDVGRTMTDCGISIVAFWNRRLSPSERAAIWNDPTVLFDSDTSALHIPRNWVEAAAGADATVAPSAISIGESVQAVGISASSVLAPTTRTVTVGIPTFNVTTSADVTVGFSSLSVVPGVNAAGIQLTLAPSTRTVTLGVVPPTVVTETVSSISDISVAVGIPAFSVSASSVLAPTTRTITVGVPAVGLIVGILTAPSSQAITVGIPAFSVSASSVLAPTTRTVTLGIPTFSVSTSADVAVAPTTRTVTVGVPTFTVSTSSDVAVAPTTRTVTLGIPTFSVSTTGSILIAPSAVAISVTSTPVIFVQVTTKIPEVGRQKTRFARRRRSTT